VAPATAADFRLSQNKTLTIAAGQTTSTGQVTIAAVDNNLDEPNKTVRVSATASGTSGVADPADVTLIIVDDEVAPPTTVEGVELLRDVITEGQSRRFLIEGVPRGFSQYWLEVQALAAPFTAEADDFVLRARGRRGEERVVAAGSSVRMFEQRMSLLKAA